MKTCLSPARLLRLDRRFFSLRNSSVLHRPCRSPGLPLVRGALPSRPQWRRQFSMDTQSPIDRQILEDYVRSKPQKCPVSRSDEKNPEAWLSLLEKYLPPSMRRSSEDKTFNHPGPDSPSEMTREEFVQVLDLANLLFYARASVNLDLLAHLGFRLNNWPAVYLLLSRLLDAADVLQGVSIPPQCGIIGNWGSTSSLTLDQLTDQCLSSAPRLDAQCSKIPQVPGLTTLDAFTERPFAQDHAKAFMAEVWQSLGSIVLDAADASPSESKLAMSYVFRVLARLHHSGAVSDRVYKYNPPDKYQAIFRPPGLHVLSTHIMDVLSDTAWLAHEAEVAAKALAAGEDPPFLPVKMGIRELGPEIWLEFILWCCVEHGHIKEGVWVIDQLRKRTDDQAWKFQSWKPLLDQSSVQNIKIDAEASWHHHPEAVDRPSLLRKRSTPLAPFNGLGRRTISVEVAAALLDNLPNLVYLGLGYRGLHASALLRSANCLKFVVAPTTPDADAKLLPTNKESNWFVVRVVESGGLNPETDPQTFEEFLKVTPCVVPPWSSDMCPVDDDSLQLFRPSQLYDDTAALAGLIEYNLRFYCARRLCGDALNMFVMLQSVIDTSKMQRINEFFSSRLHRSSTSQTGGFHSLKPFESSVPQISNVTLAELLDLITASRAFAFGEWLLFSDDVDGPAIPPSAYRDQALAPSIIRFAAATKNTALGESVIRSLAQPISANTLRALLNFRIAMHQWDLVVPMLEYLRDYRSKSWGHSNVASLAAEIIRLDHNISLQQQSDLTSMAAPLEGPKQSISQAQAILLRILNGEFNELPHLTTAPRFQERTLYALHQIFLSIPTSTSPSLRETAKSASLQFKPRKTTRNALPTVPITSFHLLLSALVDTTSSAAGKRLWDQWCIDINSPAVRRLQEGGLPRLYLGRERNRAKGDPHFDPAYFRLTQKKVTAPNSNTVRIIAQKAVAEYEEFEKQHASPSSSSSYSDLGSSPPRNPAQEILEFCIQKFDQFGLRRREINREVGGLVYRKRREHDKEKKRRLREGKQS